MWPIQVVSYLSECNVHEVQMIAMDTQEDIQLVLGMLDGTSYAQEGTHASLKYQNYSPSFRLRLWTQQTT